MDNVLDLNNFIKPELLVFVPVLIIIGNFLKASFVGDKHIPLILGGVSVVFSCVYILVMSGENVAHALITGFVQGILCAGVAVYGNQIFKQYTKKDK